MMVALVMRSFRAVEFHGYCGFRGCGACSDGSLCGPVGGAGAGVVRKLGGGSKVGIGDIAVLADIKTEALLLGGHAHAHGFLNDEPYKR